MKDDSKEQKVQEAKTSVETSISNNVEKQATPPIVKKKSVIKKQEVTKKSSNTEMGKPLVEQKQRIAIESSIQSGMKISQEDMDSMTSKTQKSAIEINSTNIEKKRNKRTGIKKSGITSDIWEKVNRKGF